MANDNQSFGEQVNAESALLLLILSMSREPMPISEVLITADVIRQTQKYDVAGVLLSVQSAIRHSLASPSEFSLFVWPLMRERGLKEVPLIAVALQRLQEDRFIVLSDGIAKHSTIALTATGREAADKLAQGLPPRDR